MQQAAAQVAEALTGQMAPITAKLDKLRSPRSALELADFVSNGEYFYKAA